MPGDTWSRARSRRTPTAPKPSSSRGDGVGWGISRMESHQREANGKEASKPATTGLAVDSQVAGGSFPASSREAGRSCSAREPCALPIWFPVARLRVSAFLRPRPPRSTQPGGATHVLLHFSQVLLREGRRGSLHGRGRDGVLPARATPPRLRAPASGNQAVTLGGQKNRSWGNGRLSERGGGDLSSPLPAPPLGPAAPHSGSFLTQAPPSGEAGPPAGPAHLRASQSLLARRFVPSSGMAPPTAGVPLTTPHSLFT